MHTIPEYKCSLATKEDFKLEDHVHLETAVIPTEETKRVLLIPVDTVLLLSQFQTGFLTDNGLFNGLGSEEVSLSVTTTRASITPSLEEMLSMETDQLLPSKEEISQTQEIMHNARPSILMLSTDAETNHAITQSSTESKTLHQLESIVEVVPLPHSYLPLPQLRIPTETATLIPTKRSI